jgi:hypothetical protein
MRLPLAFLFIAAGSIAAEASDARNARVGWGDFVSGDAVRIADVADLTVSGSIELVLCLPRLPDDAND